MSYSEFFKYNDIKIDGKIRLSPSSFCNFYESAGNWYKTQILKDNEFTGNTNTVVGTIIHARLGAYWSGVKVDSDTELEYISQYDANPEVDCWKVADDVDRLFEAICEEHSEFLRDKPEEVEQSLQFEIPDSEYFIGGTFDYRRKNVLGDIKTISTTPKAIKFNHKFQLYTYEMLRRLNDMTECDTIEVLYIVKLKKPKAVIIQEPIDEEFMEYVKTEYKKMVVRLDMCKDNEDLAELMFPNNPNSYL